MFGESDSESPRVPSPWDSLISTPPSPHSQIAKAVPQVPRLCPEAEEGNIEYKLQLLAPSPARFTRLVTQLKWRLLEGGGQAYYELGVADSGALVGLPRAELEQSLETLEMMAGEIGASVIVVKEIEIPAGVAGLAGANTDNWNNKRYQRMAALDSNSATFIEKGTDFSTTGSVDVNCHDISSFCAPPCPRHLHPISSRLTTHMSLLPELEADLSPIDSDLENAQRHNLEGVDNSSPIRTNLEIASVFKPRPTRKGFPSYFCGSKVLPKTGRHGFPPRNRKHEHSHHSHAASAASGVVDEGHIQTKQHAKFLSRRLARDRRREEKQKVLLSYANPVRSKIVSSDRLAVDLHPDSALNDLAKEMDALHVLAELDMADAAADTKPTLLDLSVEDRRTDTSVMSQLEARVGPGVSGATAATSTETRLIVEALVVRKMSLDEAFLDFGGFSLI